MNFNITDVVRNLLFINVILYFSVTYLLPPEIKDAWFSVYYPTSENFRPVQLLTYMFMHHDGRHLLFNMLGLVVFGPAVEYSWGPKRFLFYYLFAGFGALALDFGVKFYQIHAMGYPADFFDFHSLVGASGAVFGLLAAYGLMFPNNVLQLLFPPIPIKAKYLVLGYAGIELYSGFTGSNSGIAHFAHIGGALFGFLLIMYWRNGGTIGRD